VTSPVVVVENVGKTFRRYHADRPSTIQEAVAKGLRRMKSVERSWGLRDVSFTVGAGKAVGIIGSNGSGKSTLLRLIGGVGRPDTGQIDVHGRIGALLDLGAGFHPDLTGRENALLAGILNGLTRRQVIERLDSIVAFAEVEKAFDHPMRTYSSGMQMRLAFSVAVHTDPEILLIDEVLSVGDIAFQRKCLDRIATFKAAGCAILLVSHEGSMVQDFCDEAVWLSGGRLMAQGDAADVVRQYAAHMGFGEPELTGEPVLTESQPLEESYPVATPPPPTVRTTRGDEVPLDEESFGSMALKIGTIRVLDGEGQPVTEVASGQPLRIEIGYTAMRRLVAPIFYSRILREDGLLCYNLSTQFSTLSLSAVQGHGCIALYIERLDLNTGRYVVDAGCFAQDWAYAYDYALSETSLVVRGHGARDPVLNAPHRWEVKEGSAASIVIRHEPGPEGRPALPVPSAER
jgi:lipopolysaccharide transport system ATP-binding protein